MNKTSSLERNLQFSVLQFVSWPALPDLLLETAPNVTRICALLARKPSAGMLIPVILDMPAPLTYSLLDTLYDKGHIRPMGDAAPLAASASPSSEPVKAPEDLPIATASFISKVWQRLMVRK